MGQLTAKNKRDTVTFEVEGPFKTLEELLKKLIKGDSFSLEIDEFPSVPTRFMQSADSRVKTEEAFISLSCPEDKYHDVIEYISLF